MPATLSHYRCHDQIGLRDSVMFPQHFYIHAKTEVKQRDTYVWPPNLGTMSTTKHVDWRKPSTDFEVQ